jgi:hypothetical protein
MSGTSWFDLTSIQDQINKSIQEAAKIAEEASKYDILNFDGMAEQDEDEEREYDSEEEELQTPSTNAKSSDIDTNYAAKTQRSPDVERNAFRSESVNQTPVAHKDSSSPISSTHQIVKTEASINKSVSFDDDDDDDDDNADFPTVMNGRSDIHVKAGDIQLPSFDLGTPYTPVHDYRREKLEEDHHDVESLKGSSVLMPVSATNGLKPSRSVPVPHIVPLSTSLPSNGDDTSDLVSDTSSPQKKSLPSKNVDGVQKLVSNSDDRNEHKFNDTGSHFQEISLNSVYTAENKQKGVGIVDYAVTPSSSYRSADESVSEVVVTEGLADDFFGDQFKNIGTVKKEKLASSTFISTSELSTIVKNAPSSSSVIREPIISDKGEFYGSNNFLKVTGITSVLVHIHIYTQIYIYIYIYIYI